VGACVGRVGALVGRLVGSGVGAYVGCRVFALVGYAVAPTSVGAATGAPVACVGLDVSILGLRERGVGDFDGLAVGCGKLGDLVGLVVDSVGEDVGEIEAPTIVGPTEGA
jgi:hypothetical protein